jgi:soluble cytochrome b562
MWDEMVIVLVIKKDDKMATTFKVAQIDVEGSSMIKALKKQKKDVTIEKKREKAIDNLVMKKYPKGFDEIECKHVDESIRSKFINYFPFGNKHVEGVKVLMDRFLPPLRKIVYIKRYTQEQNKTSNFDVSLH